MVYDLEKSLHLEPEQVWGSPLERWESEHQHEHHPPLHTEKAMRNTLAPFFSILEDDRCAYLYRYFLNRIPQTEKGLLLAKLLKQEEEDLIARGEIVPIGYRCVLELARNNA